MADDNGYGWAIAKSLAAAGAEILVGTWVPVSKLKLWHFSFKDINNKSFIQFFFFF